MKMVSALAAVLLAFLVAPGIANAGWQQTFSDEFDGKSLDTTKWKFGDYWGNQTIPGNGEKQCYRPDAVSQADGMLLLTARRGTTPVAACKTAKTDLHYISGMVTTAGCNPYEKSPVCAALKPFAQAYGYFEIRAKLTKGMGFWPAFWLLPIDGGWPPEIDVLEALGRSPMQVFTSYHYNDPAGAHQGQTKEFDGHDFTETFSTFGVDWRPGLIIWYIDGRETFRFTGPGVTAKKMYLVLNLAVGGNWPQDPDETTPFPSSFAVDYVRVYKRIDDGKPDDLPPGVGAAAGSK